MVAKQELCDVICTCLDPREGATFVSELALHYGSEDNCSVVIVPFGAWGKYAQRKNIKFRASRTQVGSGY